MPEQSNLPDGLDTNNSKGVSIDVREVVNRVVSLWPWALICSVIAILCVQVYFYFSQNYYHVKAMVVIQDSDKSGGSKSGDLNMLKSLGLSSGSSNLYNEMEILKSYTLMNEVVHEMQLNVAFYVKKGMRTHEVYGNQLPFKAVFKRFNVDSLKSHGNLSYSLNLKRDRTGVEVIVGGKTIPVAWYDTVDLPVGQVTFLPNHNFSPKESVTSYNMVVNNFGATSLAYKRAFTLSLPNNQATVINMTLNTNIPKKGELILDHIINTYMRNNVEDNNRMADSTMSFIDRRLVIVSEQLSDIERKIQSFKQTNKIADITSQSQALIQSNSAYERELTSKQVQLSVIEGLQGYILKNKDNPRIVPASLMVQNSMLSDIISRYNDLLLEKSRLLLNATENNPVVQNLDKQIVSLRSDLISGIASVRNSALVAIDKMQNQQMAMQSEIQKVPAKERISLDFSRKQDVRQQLYLFLLQQREEAAISKSATVANIRIVDIAMSQKEPYSPQKGSILLVAFLVGIGLPFGIAYIWDMLNTKIGSRSDIEKETKLPIVGEIGHSQEEDLLVVNLGSRTIISEQFRALRTNLQFLLPDKDKKVILVTSSMGSEGKSFISSNLAMALAITDKRVALMELDLRKPKISKAFNLNINRGFSGYVIGQAEMEDIIYPSGLQDNLFIIPAGSVPPNPAELILHHRTKELIERLRQEFDYIIIDTTPNLVTDAQLLGQYADASLYLVRIGVTHRGQLRLPNELAKNHKMPNLNLVVNDVKQNRYGGGYYGYGYGGYGYGYGYGEYAEKEKKNKKGKHNFLSKKP